VRGVRAGNGIGSTELKAIFSKWMEEQPRRTLKVCNGGGDKKGGRKPLASNLLEAKKGISSSRDGSHSSLNRGESALRR